MVFVDDAINHQGLENLIGVLYIVRTDLVLSSQTSLDIILIYIPEISIEKEWAIGVTLAYVGVVVYVAHWMWMVGVPHTTIYNIYVRGPF